MNTPLTIVINAQKILEYNRNNRLPRQQRRSLDEMDRKMDGGIRLGEDDITQPDGLQRAQFVANMLINALFSHNEPLTAATCAWLATRPPELQQVQAKQDGEGVAIEFVFDRNFKKSSQEQVINFVKPGPE